MSSEEMEKVRLLESEKRYRMADRWLNNFEAATWDEVRTFIRSFVIPGDEMTVLLSSARKYERDGKQPGEIGGLEDQLSIELGKMRLTHDQLSRIGSVIPPGETGGSMPWSILRESVFLSPLDGDGGFLTITGKPRKGKTGVGCLYGEMWLAKNPGCQVLTNVPIHHRVDGILQISEMSSLLDAVANALQAEHHWLWIFDEGGLAWLRAEAMTTRARGLEKFARIVPKLKGSLVFIEQRIEGVPTVLMDFAQSHIYCTSPGFVIADLPSMNSSLRDVPRPHVMKYRSGETGFFEVDVDMDKLLQSLPERGHKSQADRIRSFLQRHREMKERKRDSYSGRFQPAQKESQKRVLTTIASSQENPQNS